MDNLEKIISWQEQYGEKIDAIHLLLHGNGVPERGFIVRLIRLERIVMFGTRLGWLTGGAVATSAIGYAFSIFV